MAIESCARADGLNNSTFNQCYQQVAMTVITTALLIPYATTGQFF